MPARIPARISSRIFVLAGVNGAGKSSIGGEALRAAGLSFYNPDLYARRLLEQRPTLPATQANAIAWELGRDGLMRALANGETFAFETTLGGNTIADILLQGARAGAQLHIWYAGLDSVERHLRRIRSRVAAGGHDIPGPKVRQRYVQSIKNLIRLLPVLASLRVYDNSFEADPKLNRIPRPVLVLRMAKGRILDQIEPASTPEWAKPLIAAAARWSRSAGASSKRARLSV